MVEAESNQYSSAIIKWLGEGKVNFALEGYRLAEIKNLADMDPFILRLLGYSVLMESLPPNEFNLPNIKLACKLISPRGEELYKTIARKTHLESLESNLELHRRIMKEGYDKVFPEVEFLKLSPQDLLLIAARDAKLAESFGGSNEVASILERYGLEYSFAEVK